MGVLTIRLPESLHGRIRKLAEEEGVSMNHFITLAAAEKATALEGRSQIEMYRAMARQGRELAAEQKKTPAEMIRAMMDRGPDEEPAPEDRLPQEFRDEE